MVGSNVGTAVGIGDTSSVGSSVGTAFVGSDIVSTVGGMDSRCD